MVARQVSGRSIRLERRLLDRPGALLPLGATRGIFGMLDNKDKQLAPQEQKAIVPLNFDVGESFTARSRDVSAKDAVPLLQRVRLRDRRRRW
jgi:hypothetical protein